jgi:hypothetical protein
MADEVFMYGIVAGVFAVFTGILFGCRVKRHSGEVKTEKKEGRPIEHRKKLTSMKNK